MVFFVIDELNFVLILNSYKYKVVFIYVVFLNYSLLIVFNLIFIFFLIDGVRYVGYVWLYVYIGRVFCVLF